jgi:hypothetical protein
MLDNNNKDTMSLMDLNKDHLLNLCLHKDMPYLVVLFNNLDMDGLKLSKCTKEKDFKEFNLTKIQTDALLKQIKEWKYNSVHCDLLQDSKINTIQHLLSLNEKQKKISFSLEELDNDETCNLLINLGFADLVESMRFQGITGGDLVLITDIEVLSYQGLTKERTNQLVKHIKVFKQFNCISKELISCHSEIVNVQSNSEYSVKDSDRCTADDEVR